jgi:hypothetical protein
VYKINPKTQKRIENAILASLPTRNSIDDFPSLTSHDLWLDVKKKKICSYGYFHQVKNDMVKNGNVEVKKGSDGRIHRYSLTDKSYREGLLKDLADVAIRHGIRIENDFTGFDDISDDDASEMYNFVNLILNDLDNLVFHK